MSHQITDICWITILVVLDPQFKLSFHNNLKTFELNYVYDYLAVRVHHHHFLSNDKHDKSTMFLRNECINYLMNELEYKMNIVIENYPIEILKPFLYPLKNRISLPVLENKNKLYELIMKDKSLHEIFKNDIYYKDSVLEKMEKLMTMDKNSAEYELLYQDIIKVGEYPI